MIPDAYITKIEKASSSELVSFIREYLSDATDITNNINIGKQVDVAKNLLSKYVVLGILFNFAFGVWLVYTLGSLLQDNPGAVSYYWLLLFGLIKNYQWAIKENLLTKIRSLNNTLGRMNIIKNSYGNIY